MTIQNMESVFLEEKNKYDPESPMTHHKAIEKK
jgi:hypothetical protein